MILLGVILVILGMVTPYIFQYNSLFAMDKLWITFKWFPTIRLTNPNSYLIYIGYIGSLVFLILYFATLQNTFLYLTIYFTSVILGVYFSVALLKK